MLTHFRRATRVKRAASRRRGAGSEDFDGLLDTLRVVVAKWDMPRPGEPFERWPEATFFSADYGHAWWCADATIVSHTTVTHGYERGAVAYLDFEAWMLEEHREDVANAGGMFVIHDWRSVSDYDSDARRHWQNELRARPKGYLRGSAVCVARVAPLLKMAVQAANLVASMTQGVKVELTTDLSGLLRHYDPRPRAH